MTDYERVGLILRTRTTGIVPMRFFCSCKDLLRHVVITSSEMESIKSQKAVVCSYMMALGIAFQAVDIIPVVRDLLASNYQRQYYHGSLDGFAHVLKYPNSSLQWLLHSSVASEYRKKHADSLFRGFAEGMYDISDDILLELFGSASKSVYTGQKFLYHLFVHKHNELLTMILKRFDEKSKLSVGGSVMLLCAQDGNIAALKWFARRECRFDVVDGDGRPPLSVAVLNGHIAFVRDLLTRKVTTDLVDKSGNSLLHLACLSGSVEMVEFVFRTITPRSLFLKQNKDGLNCLHIAAKNGYWKIVEWCLKNDFNANGVDANGLSPLNHASAADSALSIKELHSHNAQCLTTSDGEHPLFTAIRHRRVDNILQLLELYRLSSLTGSLRLAVKLGYTEVVEVFMNQKVVIGKALGSEHPLFVAVTMGKASVVKAMLIPSVTYADAVLFDSFKHAFSKDNWEISNLLSPLILGRSPGFEIVASVVVLFLGKGTDFIQSMRNRGYSDLEKLAKVCGIEKMQEMRNRNRGW